MPNAISQDDVHARTRACVREYANLTDWLLLIDTDEHIYAEHDGATRNALSQVLGLLEHEGGHGALVPWSMMYGEQLTLEAQIPSEDGLMRAFPRVLSVAQVRIATRDALKDPSNPRPPTSIYYELSLSLKSNPSLTLIR